MTPITCLDGDLAGQRLLELVVVREALADQPRLVRPDDGGLAVPHVDSHDLREALHEA
jgi:hypothetical protein